MFVVNITIDNNKDMRALHNMNVVDAPYLNIFDERVRSQKSQSYSLKNKYAARENPFIEIYKNGEFYKVIYKEACEDPIKELINICNNDSN